MAGIQKIARTARIFGNRSAEARDPDPILDTLGEARGAIAYDVGANVGAVAEILSRNFRVVFAFEPATESYSKLVARNNPKVSAFNIAVSNINGIIPLDVRDSQIKKGQLVTPEVHGLSWGDVIGQRLVPALTLDSIADSLPKPDFVKIDTEGHELRVLEGAKLLLSNSRTKFLIEIHEQKYGEAIESMLVEKHNTELIRHPGHRESSDNWRNHYFIVASPKGDNTRRVESV